MSGRDNLRIAAAIKGVGRARIEECPELVGPANRAKHRFRTYSLGMKQRLALAATMLNDPELVILDEPAHGLDPQQPVDKIPPAFDRRCIRAGRFASPVHAVKHTSHYVMSTIHFATPRLRSALLLGRIALLFPLRRALPARHLAALGARAALSTDCQGMREIREIIRILANRGKTISGLMMRGDERLRELTEFLPYNLVQDLGDDLAHYPEVLAGVNADRAERGAAPLEFLDVEVMAIAVLSYSAIFLLTAFLSMRKRDLQGPAGPLRPEGTAGPGHPMPPVGASTRATRRRHGRWTAVGGLFSGPR